MTYNASSADLRLRMFDSWQEMAAIEAEWRDLHARTGGHLFSCFDWLAIHEAVFKRAEDMLIATLWERDALVAALPLVSKKAPVSKLLKRYQPDTLGLMHCKYSGFQEVLAATDGHAQTLAGKLASLLGHCNFDLDIVVDKGPTAAFLQALEQAGYKAVREPNFESVLISGNQTYDSFLAGRSSNFRKSIKKAAKALVTLEVTFKVVDGTRPDVIARIFEVSRNSWKHAAGTGVASHPSNSEFVRRILTQDKGDISSTVGFLSIPSGDVAFIIMIHHGDTIYGLWSEFDEVYERVSPGRSIIALSLLYHMVEQNATTIDFLRKTHFTGGFGEVDYAIDRFRAVPRNGFSDFLTETDRLARKLARTVREGRRKSTRRADVIQTATPQQEDKT